MLTELPPLGRAPDPAPPATDHPIRKVTTAVARDAGTWTPAVSAEVRERFDGLAEEWHTRDRPGRLDALADALERGEVGASGLCLELGSGTGLATEYLVQRFEQTVACDLSERMLAVAPPVAPRLRADGARLPLRDGAVSALVLINALLFPVEAARVLGPGGALVWVNTSGPATPIYLPAAEVLAALPGSWSAVASSHGAGTWTVARRG